MAFYMANVLSFTAAAAAAMLRGKLGRRHKGLR